LVIHVFASQASSCSFDRRHQRKSDGGFFVDLIDPGCRSPVTFFRSPHLMPGPVPSAVRSFLGRALRRTPPFQQTMPWVILSGGQPYVVCPPSHTTPWPRQEDTDDRDPTRRGVAAGISAAGRCLAAPLDARATRTDQAKGGTVQATVRT